MWRSAHKQDKEAEEEATITLVNSVSFDLDGLQNVEAYPHIPASGEKEWEFFRKKTTEETIWKPATSWLAVWKQPELQMSCLVLTSKGHREMEAPPSG